MIEGIVGLFLLIFLVVLGYCVIFWLSSLICIIGLYCLIAICYPIIMIMEGDNKGFLLIPVWIGVPLLILKCCSAN